MTGFDRQYLTDITLELCRTPSPTGYTERAMAVVVRDLERFGVHYHFTRKGALLATLPGGIGAPRGLAAHVDTLGAMVKEIKPSGRLKLTQIGGYAWSTVEGEYCLVHTAARGDVPGTVLVTKASTHIFGPEHKSQERDAATMEVRLDVAAENAAAVRALGIEVGDFVSWDPRPVACNGFIKSRHLDNKAGVAILLELARRASGELIALSAPVYLFISNYEEVGHGAAAGIPPEIGELVAVDMAAVGEGQTSDERSVTVCVKDSSGPYDHRLSRRLIDLAKAQDIPCKVDIYPYYASDASAALRAGGEYRAALVGPGIDASHSYERCHVDSLVHTTALLLAYLQT